MKRPVQLLALILAVSCLLSMTALADGEQALTPQTELQESMASKSFTDVREGQWFYKNMDILVRSGGIDGYADGSFRPDGALKLSEFLKTLTALLYGEQTARWADFEVGGQVKWYSRYVGCAGEAGLLDGLVYSDEAFEKPVDRYTMAVILVNAATAMGTPLTDDPEIGAIIGDYGSIPDRYQPYVRIAYAAGILNGVDNAGHFAGESSLRRSEACTAIVRLFRSTERVQRTYAYYSADGYTLSVVMPADWADRCIAEGGEDNGRCWLRIHCAAAWNSYGLEGGGHLLTVMAEDEAFDYPQYESLGTVGERQCYIIYPSDVQFDDASMAAYQDMVQDMNDGLVMVIVKRD